MFPILFETRYFSVQTLWVFFLISIMVGVYVLIKLSVKNGLKLQFLNDKSWELILFTIIGARIGGIIQYYPNYFQNFDLSGVFRLFAIWDKGLTIWGGVMGFIIAFYFVCKKEEQDFWKWMDSMIIAILVGVAIFSIGTFFDGTNYGRESSLPWAVNFESFTVKYAVPIHPTQIYATLYSITLAIGLLFLGHHKKIMELKQTGIVGLSGISIFVFLKFLEGFVRGDDTWMLLGIRLPQIFALTITICAVIFLYIRYKNVK